jgi:hypothetical protein
MTAPKSSHDEAFGQRVRDLIRDVTSGGTI